MLFRHFPTGRLAGMTIGLLLALLPVLGTQASPLTRVTAHALYTRHHTRHHAASHRHRAKAKTQTHQKKHAKKKPLKTKAKVKIATPLKPVTGTIVLGGTLSSDTTLTMSGAFSVGIATDLEWDLPIATSVKLDGYEEDVTPPTFVWNVPPDSFTDTSVDGNSVRQFHWDHPPARTVITVTETLRALTTSDLTPFQDNGPYPMQPVPAGVAPYLTITPNVQLPVTAGTLVSSFAAGQTTERAVVTKVANWVATHNHYPHGTASVPIDAASIFSSHTATCEGYDDVMVGMLRQLHIPVRVVFGWVSAAPLLLPGPDGGQSSLGWSIPGTSGELHTWLDVYFPSAGWVPFDPQAETFFVDPHHIALFTNIDAGPVVDLQGGIWYGAASGSAVNTAALTGAPLPDGATDEVPGDGPGSHVTINTQDTNAATFVSYRKNQTKTIIFSR